MSKQTNPINQAVARIRLPRAVRAIFVPTAPRQRILFKDIWIDRGKMTVQQGERQLHLTRREYDLLLKLIDAQGRVISREQMMHDIWETDFVGGSNVVDVHVKSLRKKLGDCAVASRYIVTVRGVGYRLADEQK